MQLDDTKRNDCPETTFVCKLDDGRLAFRYKGELYALDDDDVRTLKAALDDELKVYYRTVSDLVGNETPCLEINNTETNRGLIVRYPERTEEGGKGLTTLTKDRHNNPVLMYMGYYFYPEYGGKHLSFSMQPGDEVEYRERYSDYHDIIPYLHVHHRPSGKHCWFGHYLYHPDYDKTVQRSSDGIKEPPLYTLEGDNVGFPRLKYKNKLYFPTNLAVKHGNICPQDEVKVLQEGEMSSSQEDKLLVEHIKSGTKRSFTAMVSLPDEEAGSVQDEDKADTDDFHDKLAYFEASLEELFEYAQKRDQEHSGSSGAVKRTVVGIVSSLLSAEEDTGILQFLQDISDGTKTSDDLSQYERERIATLIHHLSEITRYDDINLNYGRLVRAIAQNVDLRPLVSMAKRADVAGLAEEGLIWPVTMWDRRST